VSVIFSVYLGGKLHNDECLVQVIGDDKSIRNRTILTSDTIQDGPASSTPELRIAALNFQRGLTGLGGNPHEHAR
jgi:hypothetical protein